jgi:hypothetical protein
MGKTEAVEILRNAGITRVQAHNVLDSSDAEKYPTVGRWRVSRMPGERGKLGVALVGMGESGGKLASSGKRRNGAGLRDGRACRPPGEPSASSPSWEPRINTGCDEGVQFAAERSHSTQSPHGTSYDTQRETSETHVC